MSIKVYGNAISTTTYSIPLDANNTAATPDIIIERNWKRKGDLLIDTLSGDYIPLRLLPKEERKKYE
jgi:hypothetical protein